MIRFTSSTCAHKSIISILSGRQILCGCQKKYSSYVTSTGLRKIISWNCETRICFLAAFAVFVELNDVVNESILQPFCDVRDISEIHIIESWAMAVWVCLIGGGGGCERTFLRKPTSISINA